jgi:hypothetical protein
MRRDLSKKGLLVSEVQEFQLTLKMVTPWINKEGDARFFMNTVNSYQYIHCRGSG